MDKFVIPAENSQNPTPFDAYRRVREDGTEYWSARDLMGLMAYGTWQKFQNPLNRAMRTAENQNMEVSSLFTRSVKKSLGRPQEDYELSRFAAYLVAMNGDPNKPEVAAAQAYFATRTRQAEVAPPTRELTGPELMARALQEADHTIKALEASRQEAEARTREAEELTHAAEARAYVAEAEAKQLEPKAHAYDTFLGGEGAYYVGTVAKMFGMGQNALFDQLREERIFIPQGGMRNTPYAQYKRHFLVRPRRWRNSEGREFLTYTTLVKPTGVDFIARRLGITVEKAA